MSTIMVDAVLEQLTGNNDEIYECPAGAQSAEIVYGNCTNEDASNATLIVRVVKSGGSIDVTNIYFPEKTILAGTADPLILLRGRAMKPGDKVYATASSASRLNFCLGIKETYAN